MAMIVHADTLRYGDGYGCGYGDGYGYGYGDGDGYGDGYGYGCGDGYGDGYGHGDGYEIAKIGSKEVLLLPTGYAKIGCQTHSIDWWEENWKKVAHENGVEISEKEAMEILEKLKVCV